MPLTRNERLVDQRQGTWWRRYAVTDAMTSGQQVALVLSVIALLLPLGLVLVIL